jgi:hypothetical protein
MVFFGRSNLQNRLDKIMAIIYITLVITIDVKQANSLLREREE